MKAMKTLGAATLACTALSAAAQSSVTLYGSIDQYINHMRSSSGAKVNSLEDGAFLRSRWGVRGVEDLGGGLQAKFGLEAGLSADQGSTADTARSFDRQAWVGLGHTGYGEVRLGRQNGSIFVRGNYIDFTTRTLGSVVNAFGTPSRFDNDFAYISPRWAGFQFDVHVAIPETALGNRAKVWQIGGDWTDGVFRVGYAGLRGKPQAGATVDKDVVYDNLFANWTFGPGTLYLTYVHSNNNTSTAVSNNAGTILGNVGGFNAGTNADLNNFYDIVQVSGDYRITPELKLGALWGQIKDKSGRNRGASGGALGAYYDLSKRTMLVALVDTLRNDANGGWRPAGSAGLKTTFTAPGDINGRTINGFQLGIVHRF